jgi:predicted  nucleic acid-binding Zn-ribbon protein
MLTLLPNALCWLLQNAGAVDELRKLRHEVTYMQGREESLQQELGERNQEVQAMRERLSGLQEKHNGLRLETLRLEQKVGCCFRQ